jgi:hypothetical protein
VVTAKTYLTTTLRHSYTFASPAGGTVHALNQGTDPWAEKLSVQP